MGGYKEIGVEATALCEGGESAVDDEGQKDS